MQEARFLVPLPAFSERYSPIRKPGCAGSGTRRSRVPRGVRGFSGKLPESGPGGTLSPAIGSTHRQSVHALHHDRVPAGGVRLEARGEGVTDQPAMTVDVDKRVVTRRRENADALGDVERLAETALGVGQHVTLGVGEDDPGRGVDPGGLRRAFDDLLGKASHRNTTASAPRSLPRGWPPSRTPHE